MTNQNQENDLIAEKLLEMNLKLPGPLKLPPGVKLICPSVRMFDNTAYLSGHGPLNADGTLAQPLGKVGSVLTLEQGIQASQLTTLSMLSSLKDALGSLDRITAWTRVFGMVNSAPGFSQQPQVINAFSELIIELFGPVIGEHSRSAVGMAELPMDIPVEIEAEVKFI
ncbi:endoribonuclease L-PSP [Luminiphilus syltensis NOR5-1B]|uniref:Endoribonuclease L-PSP n=1 Tax=Luminiphilus syltensis NOR5-1B TaxID=565045 RepID=B8KX77_9GAMM|nr:RidA family protein [Luminiphilus syltensis]EED34999.1 endoribonuclease L-PSP [Luminiphilus syltensis NOR5-1B]